jgi:predicted nucleic acid-binding protein
MGRCISYLDCHLLTACLLAQARFWTRDRRLRQVAEDLGVGVAMV